MVKVFYILALVTLCATVRVHSLQCYVCSNCGSVSAKDLKSCDVPATTTNTPTITTTNVPTIATTTDPTATTTPDPAATTTPDQTATTTPDPTATTTPDPIATTTPDPSATTTPDPTATTTPDPSATTTPDPTATTTPDPSATTTPDPSATTTPDPTATTTPDPSATITPDPSATTTPDPSATTTPDPTATTTPTASGPDGFVSYVQRKRRSVEDGTSYSSGCICENGKCECARNPLFRVADMATRALTYQCYKHEKTVGGQTVVDRGCQAIPDGSSSTACDILNFTNCKSCSINKCNSALSLQISAALVVSAFCLSYIFT